MKEKGYEAEQSEYRLWRECAGVCKSKCSASSGLEQRCEGDSEDKAREVGRNRPHCKGPGMLL